MDEVWKTIPGFPKHEVSDQGNVRLASNKKCKNITKTGKGRHYVSISVNNVTTHHSVARLMLKAFFPHLKEKEHVKFKDSDLSNLSFDNLEWSNMKQVIYTRYVVDIRNQRFGYLVALEESHRGHKTSDRSVKWLCQCDCGNTTIVSGASLRQGNTKSCGCYQGRPGKREKSNHTSMVQLKEHLFKSYKKGARERGITFNLGKQTFMSMIKENCFYCGREPSNYRTDTHTPEYVLYYSGIDRVDSTKGYFKRNCVPCCGTCNFAKRGLTLGEFFDMVKKIYWKHCK